MLKLLSMYMMCQYHSPGKTDLDLSEESPVKLERSQVQDEMVALFGSERQKRAFAAYKRNKVGTEALETALASAVTHAGTSQKSTKDGIECIHFSTLSCLLQLYFNLQAVYLYKGQGLLRLTILRQRHLKMCTTSLTVS